jgi:hypothetical protein
MIGEELRGPPSPMMHVVDLRSRDVVVESSAQSSW